MHYYNYFQKGKVQVQNEQFSKLHLRQQVKKKTILGNLQENRKPSPYFIRDIDIDSKLLVPFVYIKHGFYYDR